MEFFKNTSTILYGFLVWLAIAPRFNSPKYGESFLAYMAALLFCLIASSEIMMIKPVAFFFTIGGSIAFCYVVARMAIKFSIKK